MAAAQSRPLFESLLWLWEAGLRFASVINVGCAEGYFSVALAEQGPARFSRILNVDALEEYRESLEAIRDAIGAQYSICALDAEDGGTVELHRGAHPYWSSLRPPGDKYWATVNDLRSEAVRVPRRTLDALVAEAGLPAPYLLILDVQGAELQVLRGATATLAACAAVSPETALEDFAAVHEVMTRSGLRVADLANLSYTSSGALGWFYPVYVGAQYAELRPVEYWDAALNDETLQRQHAHRASAREQIRASLSRLKAGAWPPVERED